MARKIVWNKKPVDFLSSQLRRISEDSIQRAEQVEKAVLSRIEDLIHNPERYPPDKFKLENDGRFRAFEIKSLRVSYRFSETEIRILRIRDSKQQPKSF